MNGHWVIEFSRAAPIGGTVLYYQRGAEGDNVPETIVGRGPTTEPLVVEVTSLVNVVTLIRRYGSGNITEGVSRRWRDGD